MREHWGLIAWIIAILTYFAVVGALIPVQEEHQETVCTAYQNPGPDGEWANSCDDLGNEWSP